MLPLNYFLFLQIILFLFITPGTPRIVIISYSMNYGVQKCIWTALGDITANFIQATLVIFVIGSFFLDNSILLNLLKWIGIIYILYLAYDIYKSKPKDINSENILSKSLNFNKGDITMVLAMFSWALYSTLLKRQKYELSQISLLQVVISFGLIFLIPIYFIEYQIGFRINIDMPFILILSYVVLFPGLASFILWIKGIALIGANRSGVFLHLMPIISALMAMIIFEEKFMFYHILGACFIISGILLSNKKS